MGLIKRIINVANKINDSGRSFCIWGTCLGFEAIIKTFHENAPFTQMNNENYSTFVTLNNNQSDSMFSELTEEE